MSVFYTCDKCSTKLDGKRTTLKPSKGRVRGLYQEGVHLCVPCSEALLNDFLQAESGKPAPAKGAPR